MKRRKNRKYIEKRLFTFKVDGISRHLLHLKRTYRELFRFCQLGRNPPERFVFPDNMDEVDSEDSLRNIHQFKQRTVKHRKGKILTKKEQDKKSSTDNEQDNKTSIINERVYKTQPDKLFDEFWLLNRHLFLEPIENNSAVEKIKEPILDVSDKDILYLKIDLRDTDLALFKAKSLIERHRREFKFESKAEFKIGSSQKFIRLEKLLAYRTAYIHRQQHLEKKDRKDHPDRKKTYQHLIDLKLVKPIYVSKYDPTPIYNPKTRKMESPIAPERDFEQERRKISFYCARTRAIIKNIESKNFSFP